MIGVDELQSHLFLVAGMRGDRPEVGEEREGESYGMDAKFPAFGIFTDDWVGRRREEGVREELVTEAGAEDFDLGVMCVCFYQSINKRF